APAPATTVRASTTSTTAGPRLVDGIPQVTATPARAAVGGQVRIEGTGFTDAMWRAGGAPLWLVGRTGCSMYAQAEHSVTVSAAGRLAGELTVPAFGGCRMSEASADPVVAGAYRIAFACTACFIGELDVTAGAGRCANVAFAPNSDSLASAVTAFNIPCTEAEALVRTAGPQTGPVNGSARFVVDGFTCVRTAQSDRGLPSADYDCTSGSRRVVFHRT
ncbi:MAG TPA: hypothetical protein VJ653_07025, partial [Acidimicrobiales bacterium]|nr:hypothetical protein [Acidimicrobiales bacterium]